MSHPHEEDEYFGSVQIGAREVYDQLFELRISVDRLTQTRVMDAAFHADVERRLRDLELRRFHLPSLANWLQLGAVAAALLALWQR